jgi:hypothetical protein
LDNREERSGDLHPSYNYISPLDEIASFRPEEIALGSHKLLDLQEQARAIMSKKLLKLLESMKYHSWKYIVTLDEAWFDLTFFLFLY